MQRSVAKNISRTNGDCSALYDALDRLSGSLLGRDEPADLTQFVLSEINETLLPRVLTLHFDDIAVAQFKVAHRRVLSLELCETAEQSYPLESTDRSSIARIYAYRLNKLVAAQGNASFCITRQPSETEVETESCSVALLMDAMKALQDENRLHSFLTAIGSDALAWVYTESDAHDAQGAGPDDWVQQLARLLPAKSKGGTPAQILDQTPGCMVLTQSPDIKVIRAWDRDEVLLLALPAQFLDLATAAWRRVFA